MGGEGLATRFGGGFARCGGDVEEGSVRVEDAGFDGHGSLP